MVGKMRLTGKLLAACAALALALVSIGPSLADPPSGVTPKPGDVVGAGSDTLGFLLDQLSSDYAEANPNATSLLYGWDSVNPATNETGDPIVTKAGCAPIARPDGSSAGIAALEAGVTDPADPKAFCLDFAGSSRGPLPTDPPCASGGICFITLARDAVTWAVRDAASGGTDAPASLTLTQLKAIYRCKITNWAKVGGTNAPIQAFLPQSASGIRASWLTALGGGTDPVVPGRCVRSARGTLQDNEGTNPVLNSPGAIVPYSVADYIAQVYHSAACLNPGCKPVTGGAVCKPSGPQNRFGCDTHGVLGLGEIGGKAPMTPWPAPKPPCTVCTINPKFAGLFLGGVYAVVRFAPTKDFIPGYLEPFFAAKTAFPSGYVCTSATAQQAIRAYGFLIANGSPPRADGGTASPDCGTPHH